MLSNIEKYWSDIQLGKIVASKRIIQQYSKLIDDIKTPKKIKVLNSNGEDEFRTFYFDKRYAERPIEFIENFCKHSKGRWAGKPVTLELFQKAKFEAIFGFIDEKDGLRRYHEALTIEGRKNGKSTETSGVGNFMLLGDNEPGAQIVSIASKKDQAKIVFNEAKNMIAQSPMLSKYVKKRKSDLYVPINFSTFEPLASDSNTLDGLNIHCGIIDELHSLKDRNLYDVVKQSMSTREQPLLYMITTSGFIRESIYDDIYEYACKVLDGAVDDPRFLAFIYELDDINEWTEFERWEKSNPGLGSIKSIQTLSEFVQKAKDDPKFKPTVLTKDFNIKQNQSEAWLDFTDIENKKTFDMNDLKGSYAVGGVDLSSTTDLTCATLLIMKSGSNNIYAIQKYFMPDELIERRSKEDNVPYALWAEQGFIQRCPGERVDYTMVTNWFNEMRQEHDIIPLWVGYDPWNSQYWVKEMESTGYKMEIVRQGAQTLSQPMKQMGADLKEKKIIYNGNGLLAWCLSNTVVKRDENDNIKPVKGRNPKARIDGSVSLLIAYTVLFNKMQDYINII